MSARFLIALLPLTLVAACAGTPEATAPTEAAAAAPMKLAAGKDDDRVICVREYVVGSKRPQKVCMTNAERVELAERTRIEMRHGTQGGGRGEGGTVGNPAGAGNAVGPR